MPAAARVGDRHVCRETQPSPHRGGPVSSGCTTVLIGEALAARVGDTAACTGPRDDLIVEGCPTVLIAGKPAARRGDRTEGGKLVEGLRTVRIGREPRPRSFR
ncbi:PAAR domain-containing protein [Chondromyces crocatus]|uniref:PAAR domain-containing protein n=1 Tax=Chondromyces crocatus TaxID=52 RepID=UPI00067AD4A4